MSLVGSLMIDYKNAPSSSQCYVTFKCVCIALPTLTLGLIFFLALADGTSANMMYTETWNLPSFAAFGNLCEGAPFG